MEALIAILVVAVILLILWWVLSKFMPGNIAQVIGVIFGLILLLYAMQRLGFLNSIKL